MIAVKKMKEYIFNPLFAIFVLTVIAAFFVWINSVKDAKIRDEIHEGVDTIKKLSTQTIKDLEEANKNVLKSLGEVEQANKKLEQNYNQTIEVKEATIQSQKDIIGMLTGGDSYPSILFQKNKGFYLLVNGEYGIPNFNIQIVYFNDFLNTSINTLASYLNNNITVDNISQVYSNSFPRTYPRSLHSIELKDLNIELNKEISHGFDFIMTSEYKEWIQRIRLIPISGKWEVLYALEEVMAHDKDKTKISNISDIYFKVSQNYPGLIKDEGKTYGNESFYYMLNNDKRKHLNSSRLFNNGIEIEEKNITESLDINFFENK